MSIEDPATFGMDLHPEIQWDLNLAEAREQGYDFAFLKISEGRTATNRYCSSARLKSSTAAW
jgi:hypothetical protein